MERNELDKISELFSSDDLEIRKLGFTLLESKYDLNFPIIRRNFLTKSGKFFPIISIIPNNVETMKDLMKNFVFNKYNLNYTEYTLSYIINIIEYYNGIKY